MPPQLDAGELPRENDSDGQWTRVTNRKHNPKHLILENPGIRPRPRAPSLTVEQTRAEHSRIQSQDRSPVPYNHIADVISAHAATHTSITQAVCLGNGSFDPVDSILDWRWCAHLQTDVFLTMVNTLSKRQGSPIPCYFQEPDYTEVDKEFLRSLGHTVVETPTAFDMVTPGTLVFGVHLYKKDYAEALAKHLPAVLVGTGWELWEDLQSRGLNEIPHVSLERLRQVHMTYDRYAFPGDGKIMAFSDTTIYWRRSEGSLSALQEESTVQVNRGCSPGTTDSAEPPQAL